MAKQPDISVVIPTYKREQVLLDTIEGVLKQSHQNLELLVVDQTVDHSAEFDTLLRNITDTRLRYFRISPPSVTAAKNFALHVTQAPVALFLDDDVVLDKDLVKYHLRALAEHPEVSAVGGRVMQAGFPVEKAVLQFDELAISKGVFTATESGFTNAFPGGNCAIRVRDALAVGGFDTRYYQNAFREESDMSMKMDRGGMKIYYEPRAELMHLAAPSGGSRAKVYVELYDTAMFYRNELFFTIRAVGRGKRRAAIRKKYQLYCLSVRHTRAYKRRVLFFAGLIAAIWRMTIARQIIAKEVK